MEPQKKNFKIVTDKKSARVILPNMLTLIGVCIGLTSIRFALDGRFELAIIAIIFAALIDGLDGRIARLIKGTSKVGKELDSLTDMISFGVAPAFIMFFWKLNTLGRFGWLLCLIFVICVALRLARFNVNSSHEPSWRDNFFEGMPSPAGGLLILMPLIFELRAIGIPVQEYTPSRGNDKISRVNAVSDLFSSGVVWCPETRWAEEVVEEFAGFPNMEHDDLVDSSTQALLRFRQGGFIPLDSDEEEEPLEHNKVADYY